MAGNRGKDLLLFLSLSSASSVTWECGRLYAFYFIVRGQVLAKVDNPFQNELAHLVRCIRYAL